MRRILRVLGFATVYFFIHSILLVYLIIGTYTGSPEMTWYFQHPLEALCTMISELSRNPLLIIVPLIMALYALILGFITDLALSFLKRLRSA